ncbi:hypothetical protein ACE7GA_15085 [Roseomonas sp. CCTCC AB2023176]|uniref:AsmA family protein n=1 Tax=Roseomonas sp. CCTCC AB2023176 TaxID=3342640 RepID=UPI0035D97702
MPVLALAALAIALPRIELAGLAASRLSASLGRPVSIESLRVTPGRSLTVTARGLRLDNIPGGTRPAMAEAATVTTVLDPATLLGGPITVRRLEVQGLRLLLERAEDGTRNWRFHAAGERAAPGTADRSWFPALLDARIRDGEVVFRTGRGRALTTRIETGSVTAESPGGPVTLRAEGTHDDVPLRLEALLESVLALRDADHPYGTTLRFASGDTTLTFEGTMTAPLDVDGASGLLTLSAPAPSPLPRFGGLRDDFDGALDVSGVLERQGDLWRLTGGEGALDGGAFRVTLLQLREGSGGAPDAVTADLAFDRLDLNDLIGGAAEGEERQADLPLSLDPAQDPVVDLRLGIRDLTYARLRATDLRLAGSLGPGKVEVERLELTTSGARITASGRAEGEGGPRA